MNEAWASAVIGNIALAVYVAAGKGKTAHENRPYHGFVLNDENGRKDYHFSDGSVMHTR